jgi:hypothetical protein
MKTPKSWREPRNFETDPSVGGDGDAEHQRFGTEIQSAVRLAAIQEAKELEDAVLAGSLFVTVCSFRTSDSLWRR